MFCTECGKKNPDTAKFCAYCGAKLLNAQPAVAQEPEWDAESRFDRQEQASVQPKPAEAPQAPVQPKPAEVPQAQQWQKPAAPDTQKTSLPQVKQTETAAENSVRVTASHTKTRADGVVRANHTAPQAASPWAKPSAMAATTDKAMQAARTGKPSTIVKREGTSDYDAEIEAQDLFFEGYDSEPEAPQKPRKRRMSVKERNEKKRARYWERNLGSVIGIALTLGTLVIFALWLFLFPSGQMLLARFGLTDNASAYAGLAKTAYENENYSTAAKNYYQALLLDDDNYDYALLTAQCYANAGNTGSASTAVTMAIDINASDERAYRLLKQLYPDAASRPAAVKELLQQGATLTGNASLNE